MCDRLRERRRVRLRATANLKCQSLVIGGKNQKKYL